MSHFSDQYISDCDARTDDDDILDRRDGVSSKPVLPAFDKSIRYDRETKDYAMYLDGRYVGSARTHDFAQAVLDQLAYDMIADGQALTAAELDGAQAEDKPRCHCGAVATWEVPFADKPYYEYFCDNHLDPMYIADSITPSVAQAA